ncbi:unnamed protein product [Sphagnum jensenii]|uniref:Uncharacterized protein n=1 Tax=Sphagnum jensenii TaxID=128206 RepID=A0ABP0VZG1_9BRYO
MDLCGPLLTTSLRRSKHFAMFTNNCTRFTWVYFFKKILETLKRYKQFKMLDVLNFGVVRHLCIFPKVKETNYNLR